MCALAHGQHHTPFRAQGVQTRGEGLVRETSVECGDHVEGVVLTFGVT